MIALKLQKLNPVVQMSAGAGAHPTGPMGLFRGPPRTDKLSSPRCWLFANPTGPRIAWKTTLTRYLTADPTPGTG